MRNVVYWLDEEGNRQEKILDYGEYFTWISHPHIQEWDAKERKPIGALVGPKGMQKRYRILMGETVKVDNLVHVRDIMKRLFQSVP